VSFAHYRPREIIRKRPTNRPQSQNPIQRRNFMAIESASLVVHALLTNNGRIGHRLISAYRATTRELAARMEAGAHKIPQIRARGISEAALDKVTTSAIRLTALCGTAFERVSDAAEQLVDKADKRASAIVDKVAAGASDIDNKYAARCVELVGRATLPSLKLARDVSAWVATQVEKVGTARPARRPVRKAKRAARRKSKAAARA
jgi:hypothetical protein